MNQVTDPKQESAPSLEAPEIDWETIALLQRWMAEDATDDPEEIRIAEEELEAFKQAMNRNRAESGEPLLFP